MSKEDSKTQEVTLTPEQVDRIREAARAPGANLSRIASQHGVDVGHVRFIANRGKRHAET